MASGDDINCECRKERVASVKRCTPQDPHISLHKLIELIGDPITSDSYDRHLLVLNDFIEASSDGFWVRDLPFFMRLLDLLIDRFKKVCVYEKPLESLLSLCALMPLLTRTSEIITYGRDLQEYFSFLGYSLVRLQGRKLQDLVINALRQLLTKKAPTQSNCVKLQTCYDAVEKSELPAVIAQLLEIADKDLYAKMLEVVSILVNISPAICLKMVNVKVLDFLMIRLDPDWNIRTEQSHSPNPPKGASVPNVDIISKLLWTLLTACKDTKQIEKSTVGPSLQALRSFRYAFRALVKQQNSELLRNHLMGILLLLLDIYSDLQIVQCGLVFDIGLLSAATEMGTGNTWAAQVHFSTNENDYEFKKMLLLAICYCRKTNTIAALRPKRIIPALLKIITPEMSTIWHPLQHKKLISLVFHTLHDLVPKLPEVFVYYNGPLRLLMMIECFNIEAYDIETLRDCLKTLNISASSKHEKILDNLRIHDATVILISICDNLLSNEVLTMIIQRCLALAFSLLQSLCTTQTACKISSVRICLKLMERVINPNENDPIFDPKFLICAMDFFWEGIVWCKTNLKVFVSKGGVFKLLDVIQQNTILAQLKATDWKPSSADKLAERNVVQFFEENPIFPIREAANMKSIFPVKLVALGALVDMCDEGTCVPHLITWRKNGQTFLSMLLQLFREENLKLGVHAGADGAITDAEFPLMGHQQWYETFYEIKDPNSSPAAVDLLGSCRPKIYALIQLLTNRHEQRTAIANEHYKLHSNNYLSTQDQVTLLLAENFLALKLGESWVELNKDIEKSGIRPLTVEQEVIAVLTRRFYKWAQHIKTVQERLIQEQMKNDCKDEKQLYTILRDSKLIESLKALHELDYIARTTERMFRFVHKMTQTAQLDASLMFTDEADHHTTYMRELKVTPVFGQVISIQSNIIDPNEEKCDLHPVSPESQGSTYSTSECDDIGSDITDKDMRPSVT